MAAAVPIIMAVGTVVSTISTIKQGEAAAEAANKQAALAEQAAADSRNQAEQQEKRQRILNKKSLGDIRANMAASGIQLEGTPLDVLQESATNAELDAIAIRHGGEMRARSYQGEAELSRYRGSSYRDAAYMSGVGELLTGGARSYYYSMEDKPKRKG